MNWNQALATIKENQLDMRELISKWEDLLSATPADVTFEMFDGSVHVIPNFAKLATSLTASDISNDSSYSGSTVSAALNFLDAYSIALNAQLVSIESNLDLIESNIIELESNISNSFTVSGTNNYERLVLSGVTIPLQHVGHEIPANSKLIIRSANYMMSTSISELKFIIASDVTWISSYNYGFESGIDTVIKTNATASPVRVTFYVGVKNEAGTDKNLPAAAGWSAKLEIIDI